MENNLLSIGEMAKSRNVNVQSLRYYEKLGILCPVYVNPETGYRYYAPEQIMVLDTILLCIHLGIPLKELKNYVNADGQLEFERLLQYGRELATEKIRKIETGLASVNDTLQQINAQKAYLGRAGYYSRPVQTRCCITLPCAPKMEDEVYEKTLSRLFHMAESLSLPASFPHGIISDYRRGQWIGSRMFLEVLQSSADAVEVLLEGSYLCFQEPRERHSAPEDIFPEMLKEREHAAVIISCMTPNAYKYDAVTLEFQIRET